MRLLTRPKVVLDTNIFISGVLFGGNPGKLLTLFADDTIDVIIPPAIELEILVKMTKFSVSPEALSDLGYLLKQRAVRIVPVKKVAICRDPKDNMLLEAASAARADYLVSGDKDLLTLGSFGQTHIVTPREFLRLLQKSLTA